MNDLVIPYGISGLCLVLAAIVAGRYTVKNRRDAALAASKSPLPPTWPEMWERMDNLEERMKVRDTAFGNILTVIAAAWPKGTPRPIFDQADLDALADTLPSQWLHPEKEHQ